VRVLVVTAATGQGHLSAAGALAEAFSESGSDAIVFDAGEHPVVRAGAALYNFFLRRPPRYMSLFYGLIEAAGVASTGAFPLRSWAASVVHREKPDVVVSVHPILNQGIAEGIEQSGRRAPFAIVLTDLAPPFWRGWAEPRAICTVAPTAEAAQALRERGVPGDRLVVIGMPIAERFRAAASGERRGQARAGLGLRDDRLTLLIQAGSAGRRSTADVLESLFAAPDLHERVQVLFAAGRSSSLARGASGLAAPFPLTVFGWRDDMDVLLDAADAVFTKPGGLTIAEALGKGVPVLLDAVGGVFPQERGGTAWVEGQGLGWIVRRAQDVPSLLRTVPPIEWRERRERCVRALPGGSRDIARRILTLA
jgi:UDP-N-acetylglucosamine:LPS N-acetylglucosamine transferase